MLWWNMRLAPSTGLSEKVSAADGFFRTGPDGFLITGAEAPSLIAQLSAVKQDVNAGMPQSCYLRSRSYEYVRTAASYIDTTPVCTHDTTAGAQC